MAKGLLFGLATFVVITVVACGGQATPTPIPTPVPTAFVTTVVVTATPTPTHASEPIIAQGQGTEFVSTSIVPRGHYIATVEVRTNREAKFSLSVDDFGDLKHEIEIANSSAGGLTQYDEGNSVWEATARFDTCELPDEKLVLRSTGLASDVEWSVTLIWQKACVTEQSNAQ